MSDDSDKTEEPSEQKLQDARKKGQVCKSQDATSTLLLGATAAVLGATGAGLFRTLSGFARNWWLQISGIVDNPIWRFSLHDGNFFSGSNTSFCSSIYICNSREHGSD